MRVGTANGRLVLDVRGDEGNPPLLYLHGGPGMGCHEFMVWQGDRLAARLRLFGLDQRGVLRSDPLGTEDTLTEADLVADCEALREWLGVKRWAVLGHSFGGRVALRYAHEHPQRLSAVIFENPAWDVVETERLRLSAAADIYDELGEPVAAQRCRMLTEEPLLDHWESFEVVGALAEHGRYYDLYVHRPEAREAILQLEQQSPFPAEWRARGGRRGQRLLEEPGLLTSLVPLLNGLAVPALLVKGRYDLVCGPDQIDAFQQRVPQGTLAMFEQSGHFAQLEEPERYAELVGTFAHLHARQRTRRLRTPAQAARTNTRA